MLGQLAVKLITTEEGLLHHKLKLMGHKAGGLNPDCHQKEWEAGYVGQGRAE